MIGGGVEDREALCLVVLGDGGAVQKELRVPVGLVPNGGQYVYDAVLRDVYVNQAAGVAGFVVGRRRPGAREELRVWSCDLRGESPWREVSISVPPEVASFHQHNLCDVVEVADEPYVVTQWYVASRPPGTVIAVHDLEFNVLWTKSLDGDFDSGADKRRASERVMVYGKRGTLRATTEAGTFMCGILRDDALVTYRMRAREEGGWAISEAGREKWDSRSAEIVSRREWVKSPAKLITYCADPNEGISLILANDDDSTFWLANLNDGKEWIRKLSVPKPKGICQVGAREWVTYGDKGVHEIALSGEALVVSRVSGDRVLAMRAGQSEGEYAMVVSSESDHGLMYWLLIEGFNEGCSDKVPLGAAGNLSGWRPEWLCSWRSGEFILCDQGQGLIVEAIGGGTAEIESCSIPGGEDWEFVASTGSELVLAGKGGVACWRPTEPELSWRDELPFWPACGGLYFDLQRNVLFASSMDEIVELAIGNREAVRIGGLRSVIQ
ncbi:MAG: hypothetical protein H6716_22955 [Polyangiaceae bacterium]|nr:hypothetical protein [Polyangiaceae bacterium]